MAVDSGSNRLQLEAWKDRTMFDGRLAAAASASPAFEPGGLFEAQDTPREFSIPKYNSKPGAPATLYLDFSGQCEAGEHNQADEPDGGFEQSECELVTATSRNAFGKSTSIEVRVIKEIWQAIAEKFAQFNVNVTTVHPDVCSDRKALRVAVGRLYQECYRSMLQYR
jgi:hypothetical protein